MTFVRNGEADKFVAQPPKGIVVFLVFGSDEGLVRERTRRLVDDAVDDPKDPFQLVRLDADEVAGTPGRLAEEVRTVPLFGGRRAVHVEANQKSIVSAVEVVLDLDIRDCAVIVEAGNLKRDAPLRKLVEAARTGAAIECAPDDAASRGRLIVEEARGAGLMIADDARAALVELLGADRLSTRGELAKLMLYAHGRGAITLADVEAVVTDASIAVADEAVDAAFLGNRAGIEATLARALADGSEAGVLLGAALRHALLLHKACIAMEAGQIAGSAIESVARYSLPLRRKAAFDRQARRWSAIALAGVVERLAAAIAGTRREARMGGLIAARALWSVAEAVPRP